MGRPRKPTSLKLLTGAYDKDPQRFNHFEPTPEVAKPDIPETLGKYGREEWNRITKEMTELGVISRVERSAIEKYCIAWENERESEDIVKKEGRFIHTSRGDIREHPASKAAREYANQCFRALVEFGMTPSSRSRLHVKKKENVDHDEQRMFG